MESSNLPPESAYFLSANRNKRSVTVDFKSPAGLEILHRLIEQSDVLVENFISGKLATVGLGWDDCHKINPRLIYASITGNGAVPTPRSTPSLITVSKGMVRRGHTGRLQVMMSLLKVKVRLYLRPTFICGHSPLPLSWTDAHVTTTIRYTLLHQRANKSLWYSTGEPDGPPCKVCSGVHQI